MGAIGYQIGSPDAFATGLQTVSPLDSYYVHGISITHGTPRNHIWTYAAGLSEGAYFCAYLLWYTQTKMSGQGSLESALEMRKKERMTNGYFF